MWIRMCNTMYVKHQLIVTYIFYVSSLIGYISFFLL